MADYIAVKLLSVRSELGWFRGIFERRALPGRAAAGLPGRQKGITVPAEVFEAFYPGTEARKDAYRAEKEAQDAAEAAVPPDAAAAAGHKAAARAAASITVHATIVGPGALPGGAGRPDIDAPGRVILLQRRNWRLNGRFVEDPEDDPARFEPTLQEGDLAVIGFHGVEEPTAVTVILLAQGDPNDAPLHAALAAGLVKGTEPAQAYTRDALRAVLDGLGLPPDHPARRLTADPGEARDAEQAALGDREAARRVRQRRGREMTPEEMTAAREAAERNGHLGEVLVDRWLTAQAAGGPTRHQWVSATVANSPFDFRLLDPAGAAEGVTDVKTTSGAFGSEFYLSLAELETAAGSPVPYSIWRVSEVTEDGAWLRQSDNIRDLARALRDAIHAAFPAGVRPTTVGVSPAAAGLAWGPRVRLPGLAPAPPGDDLGPDEPEPGEEDEAA